MQTHVIGYSVKSIIEGHSLKNLKATALIIQSNSPHLAAIDTFPLHVRAQSFVSQQFLPRIPCPLLQKWKHSLRNLPPLNKY